MVLERLFISCPSRNIQNIGLLEKCGDLYLTSLGVNTWFWEMFLNLCTLIIGINISSTHLVLSCLSSCVKVGYPCTCLSSCVKSLVYPYTWNDVCSPVCLLTLKVWYTHALVCLLVLKVWYTHALACRFAFKHAWLYKATRSWIDKLFHIFESIWERETPTFNLQMFYSKFFKLLYMFFFKLSKPTNIKNTAIRKPKKKTYACNC